jgi:hypothetical protein
VVVANSLVANSLVVADSLGTMRYSENQTSGQKKNGAKVWRDVQPVIEKNRKPEF